MISLFPTAKATRHPGIEYDFDIEKNSTPTSRAPGTCINDGARSASKTRSAYARSWTIITLRARANSTSRSKKERSTTAVVGLCGKEHSSTRGFGSECSYAVTRSANMSEPRDNGTEVRLAPARIMAYVWMG